MRRLALAALLAACGTENPGTSVRLALDYDASLGLETADVGLDDRTETTAIAHELLILLPDSVVGADLPIQAWGLVAGRRVAYGASSAVPVADRTVPASLTLAACAAHCEADVLMGCGEPVPCTLGCSASGEAHCLAPTPSNGVDAALAAGATGTQVIKIDAQLDADTGQITGGLVRPAGERVLAGIGYDRVIGTGGAELAVFSFQDLTIAAGATVAIRGTRPVVLLVGGTAKLGGVIDVSGGQGARSQAGPGGGAGGSEGAASPSPCAGGPGTSTGGPADGGGGGGGGDEEGGDGGGGSQGTVPGGPRGMRCFGNASSPAKLEPLRGGGGGGRGSPGGAASAARGGGGGGALQITALAQLIVTGTIDAGGAGGEPGPAAAGNDGGGGGGGAGGAILLEAPAVTVAQTAVLVANGGGGGGGGGASATAGEHGRRDEVLAQGGAGGVNGGGGGTGGSRQAGPDVGQDGPQQGQDGGGGGGGVGGIVIRGHVLQVAGVISPRAVQADVKP
jgi:hypothetical protein